MNHAAHQIGLPIAGSTLVAVAVVSAFALLFSAYAVRTALVGRRSERRAESVGGTALVGLWLMEAFYWAMRTPGRICARLRIHPDALTWASLLVTAGCLPAALMGHFSIAGALLIAGAILDTMDGMVARQLGIASDAGEMLDAVIDRYADAFPMVGLALFYRFSAWQMAVPLAALIGSSMVSYMRAKSESMGLKLPSGLMRRHERVAYVGLALVVGPELSPLLGSPYGAVHPATLALTSLVAVLSNYAAVRLAIAGRRELVRQGRGRGGSVK